MPLCDRFATGVLVLEWLAQDTGKPIHGAVGGDPECVAIILGQVEYGCSSQEHFEFEGCLAIGIEPVWQ